MTQRQKALEIYEIVRKCPGIRIAQIAEVMQKDYSRILSRLASLQRYRLLLYEDEKSRLYPFG